MKWLTYVLGEEPQLTMTKSDGEVMRNEGMKNKKEILIKK